MGIVCFQVYHVSTLGPNQTSTRMATQAGPGLNFHVPSSGPCRRLCMFISFHVLRFAQLWDMTRCQVPFVMR